MIVTESVLIVLNKIKIDIEKKKQSTVDKTDAFDICTKLIDQYINAIEGYSKDSSNQIIGDQKPKCDKLDCEYCTYVTCPLMEDDLK